MINLFTKVNNFLIELMWGYGCNSCFGTYCKHVGITKSLKGLRQEAWVGFNLAKHESIMNCSLLTREFQVKRSHMLMQALEIEVQAFPRDFI